MRESNLDFVGLFNTVSGYAFVDKIQTIEEYNSARRSYPASTPSC